MSGFLALRFLLKTEFNSFLLHSSARSFIKHLFSARYVPGSKPSSPSFLNVSLPSFQTGRKSSFGLWEKEEMVGKMSSEMGDSVGLRLEWPNQGPVAKDLHLSPDPASLHIHSAMQANHTPRSCPCLLGQCIQAPTQDLLCLITQCGC